MISIQILEMQQLIKVSKFYSIQGVTDQIVLWIALIERLRKKQFIES